MEVKILKKLKKETKEQVKENQINIPNIIFEDDQAELKIAKRLEIIEEKEGKEQLKEKSRTLKTKIGQILLELGIPTTETCILKNDFSPRKVKCQLKETKKETTIQIDNSLYPTKETKITLEDGEKTEIYKIVSISEEELRLEKIYSKYSKKDKDEQRDVSNTDKELQAGIKTPNIKLDLSVETKKLTPEELIEFLLKSNFESSIEDLFLMLDPLIEKSIKDYYKNINLTLEQGQNKITMTNRLTKTIERQTQDETTIIQTDLQTTTIIVNNQDKEIWIDINSLTINKEEKLVNYLLKNKLPSSLEAIYQTVSEQLQEQETEYNKISISIKDKNQDKLTDKIELERGIIKEITKTIKGKTVTITEDGTEIFDPKLKLKEGEITLPETTDFYIEPEEINKTIKGIPRKRNRKNN